MISVASLNVLMPIQDPVTILLLNIDLSSWLPLMDFALDVLHLNGHIKDIHKHVSELLFCICSLFVGRFCYLVYVLNC